MKKHALWQVFQINWPNLEDLMLKRYQAHKDNLGGPIEYKQGGPGIICIGGYYDHMVIGLETVTWEQINTTDRKLLKKIICCTLLLESCVMSSYFESTISDCSVASILYSLCRNQYQVPTLN